MPLFRRINDNFRLLKQRDVDWDVAPTEYDEITNTGAYGPPVVATSYYGFENASPSVAFTKPGNIAGGTYGPSDLGGGIRIDLGPLDAGASDSFSYYYALNETGQSLADLDSEVAGLGATELVTTYSSDSAHTNSAVLAFSGATSVLEPGCAAVGAILAAGGLLRRRRVAAL